VLVSRFCHGASVHRRAAEGKKSLPYPPFSAPLTRRLQDVAAPGDRAKQSFACNAAVSTAVTPVCMLTLLVAGCALRAWTKKTYNNAVSALRRAFDFGFKDHPEAREPAAMLRSPRIGKKDRPRLIPSVFKMRRP
jgi:hypothetical protein